MHLILTGATGIVGSAILNHILHHHTTHHITKLTILTRNSSIPVLHLNSHQPPPPTLNLNIIPHTDFLNYPPTLLSSLSTADALIWALGISQNAVTQSEYLIITRDYTLAAAKAFGSNPSSNRADNKPFKFIFISGEGATLTPGRFTPLYGRVKGETEAALLSLNASTEYPDLRIYNVRPGAVNPASDPEVAEATRAKRYQGMKRLETMVLPAFGMLVPGMVTPTRELGRVVTELAVGDGEAVREGRGVSGKGRTVGNAALKRLGGLVREAGKGK